MVRMLTRVRRHIVAVAAALTVGAGVIHAKAAASHRGDALVPVLFALAAVTQIVVGAALVARPRRGTMLASSLLNVVAAVAWLASRLTGLPFIAGLAAPEAVGRQDLTTVLMEVAAAGAGLFAGRRPHQARSRGLSPVWALAAIPMLIGFTAPYHHPGLVQAPRRDDGVALAADPIFFGADTPKASEQQLQAARDLIVRTREAMGRQFSDEASVVAAGYRSIGDGGAVGSYEHFIKTAYLLDGRELDPDHVESIVLERTASGKRVVSAMFVLELGRKLADAPDIAGGTAAWHDHQNLCWDDSGVRLTGRVVNGRCQPGGTFRPTPPMLHVWLQDHPCGPFAGIDGHGGACATAHRH